MLPNVSHGACRQPLSASIKIMNTIQFIENKIPLIESYHKLKSIDSLVYHTQLRKMESRTNLWIIEKDKIGSLEEAMLIQILVDEMKFGNYHFTQKDENKVLELNLKLLNEKYNCEIKENSKKGLKSLFEDYGEKSDVVTKNYDWPNQIDKELIKNEPCFQECVIKSFQLKDVWNDVDYVFETENYFVRFNWGTSA